jgi:hypothetical protein
MGARGRIFLELMTSNCKLKAFIEGSKKKDLRDLKDLTIHDVQPVALENMAATVCGDLGS